MSLTPEQIAATNELKEVRSRILYLEKREAELYNFLIEEFEPQLDLGVPPVEKTRVELVTDKVKGVITRFRGLERANIPMMREELGLEAERFIYRDKDPTRIDFSR